MLSLENCLAPVIELPRTSLATRALSLYRMVVKTPFDDLA
jgi:hypothetical protein